MTETTHHADDILQEGQYIPRSYQFERDMEPATLEKREDFLQFSDKANVHFMFHSAEKLIEKDKEPEDLKKMVAGFFGDQIERLQILESYSNGNNYTILNGRKRLEPEKADYRIRHDLGGQASRFFTGYTVGQPISIGSTEIDLDLTSVDNFNSYNDIEALNRELVYDASRFGRAFELHYFDEFEQPAVVLIDAKEMFTIRSADVRKEIIAAVHCPIYNGKLFVTVYTDREIVSYDNDWKESDRKPNPFNMVPVVEWQNNRERLGDWEKGIPIVDAYDAAESDTANYMSDLNDAMLVIKGDVESTGMNASDIMKMKQANMLVLESGIGHNGQQTSLEAGYIYKQYDVSGVEAYKSRLIKDFFRIVGLPNLQDDATFSATSGIAIRYKLVDLQQVTSVKRGFFIKALKRRYKLLQSLSENLKGFEAVDANLLTFTFHENLPTDVWAEIQSAINSGMDISQETLMESASFTDARKEKSRLLKEGGASDAEINQIVGDADVGQADKE
ncbi:TPA: phage portal protein [Streptococcus suis]|uniref:phage portal protein n=1 Tax=Streptococcus suis TaxID=1307 RepID=UPI0004269909|nr:phage portal protein [Streptococcus suis]NQM40352.1 phage portal protein [Streptococcus suis]QWS31640.1 phage portal protein [Streptococcus suis]HEM3173041.1 phage portal protein [Streptococcus suis]HEM4055539.1 phage portal protein [Streptococcus suis]HEM4059293.1 phage portal protein [Streptococcus suis]